MFCMGNTNSQQASRVVAELHKEADTLLSKRYQPRLILYACACTSEIAVMLASSECSAPLYMCKAAAHWEATTLQQMSDCPLLAATCCSAILLCWIVTQHLTAESAKCAACLQFGR